MAVELDGRFIVTAADSIKLDVQDVDANRRDVVFADDGRGISVTGGRLNALVTAYNETIAASNH